MVMGLPEKWDTCFRTISVGDDAKLAHWGNIIAVRSISYSILLLDAITGSQIFALSGHTDYIQDLAFSVNGALLVSGSSDHTAKLWDIQTGGIIKSFNHSNIVVSVSILPDSTTIATGTHGGEVHLWDVHTEKHQSFKMHDEMVTVISPFPTNPQHLISLEDKTVKQWDTDGNVIGTFHCGTRVYGVAYALDGACFVVCGKTVAAVVNSESSTVMVKFHSPTGQFNSCCFSPNGRFVACGAGSIIYIWDITNSEAHLVGKLVGHSDIVCSIVFTSSSSLVSGSWDYSVRIWQCSSFLTDLTSNTMTAPLTPVHIKSVNVSTKDGVIITSDSSGAVKTWDLTTSACKSSFSTPAPAEGVHDTYLMGNGLIIVWAGAGKGKEYHIWDVGEGQLCKTLESSLSKILDLRISGDGPKIFGVCWGNIECMSMDTGTRIGIGFISGPDQRTCLVNPVMHGSKIWFEDSKDQGWDFGGQEVTSFSLSRNLSDMPPLCLVYQSTQVTSPLAWIKDTITGRLVFRLPEKYTGYGTKRRFDGVYLSLIPSSGEVIVLDFSSVCFQ